MTRAEVIATARRNIAAVGAGKQRQPVVNRGRTLGKRLSETPEGESGAVIGGGEYAAELAKTGAGSLFVERD
ncbi:hypothetical protein KCP76_16515 [Salmonella enterica subsp. enterica serovar Weltevreden]|nr:hypothetical protein KCP76_16515 [Salmonella enterica subsp. enterica serovar Weltevreden]